MAGGRCREGGPNNKTRRRFNPRPPLLAGDARTGLWRSRARACFNPRPPLLAGDAVDAARRRAGSACFNPRPPLLAGDAWRADISREPTAVSIRARHCWRAMPSPTGATAMIARFQSAPAIAGGRCPLLALACLLAGVFQSAPAIAGGGCSRPTRATRSTFPFNPPPPLPAGGAPGARGDHGLGLVSIRARHCWRAMRKAS